MGTEWQVPMNHSNPMVDVAHNASVPQSQSIAVDNQNKRYESSLKDNQGGRSDTTPTHLDDSQDLPSYAVFDAIAMKLDFSYGFKFKAEVKKKFGTTMHPLGKSNHFLLVVSFGRAVFKLNEDMVGISLESCIGGNCDDLSMKHLNERVYRFSVSSKSVGFMINALRSFSCSSFKCYFHLWGNGGPAWFREFSLWQSECDKEWILVSPNKGRTDKAMAALHIRPQKSAMVGRNMKVQAKKRLTFAAEVAYPACVGYSVQSQKVSNDPQSPSLSAGLDSTKVIIADNILKVGQEIQIPFGTASRSTEQSGQIQTQADELAPNRASISSMTQVDPRTEFHKHGLDGLEDVIDDIAYRFWECGRCLSMGHTSVGCTRDIRCRTCFNYGHKEQSCLIWLTKKSKKWVPKTVSDVGQGNDSSKQNPTQVLPADTFTVSKMPQALQSPVQSPREAQTQHAPSPQNPSPPPLPATMANFEVDPARWLPLGHHIIDGGPTRLPRTFYNPSQDPFEIGADVFVCFVPHNDQPNHRAVQGVRSGWLMVLCVPLDFHNDYDIANAVAAFGKYQSWHQDGIIKERTLIQASFDSPALVPRDIVFGNYSTVGGIKETWTAPVYIFGANFAEQLPADEDQMPLDGNPHHLPGNLMPHDNLFVLSQYPELGWNNAPNNVNDQQNNQDDLQEIVQDNDMQEKEAVEELVDDSIVVNPSGLASPVAEHGMEVDQPIHNNIIHIGMVRTVFGPVIPPSMQCEKLLGDILPPMFASLLPKSPNVWALQDGFLSSCFWQNVAGMQMCLMAAVHKSPGLPLYKKKRPVARVLCYEENLVDIVTLEGPSFSASPATAVGKKRKSRVQKSAVPVAIVDTIYRSTRNCTKRDGHKPVSMSDTVSRPRKKSKGHKKEVSKGKL
ncbi:hypothetical protein ACQ4PT_030071 [Festuca glaucescens]